MILPDVNVLVYAYRREAPDHDVCAAWLADVVGGREELALVDHCLTGFLRIVTNPRVFSDPAPTAEAMGFVDRLRRGRRARAVSATATTWSTLARFVADDRAVRGNLVPDAYLAALAVSQGCRLATADRGFARFEGLEVVDPTRLRR